MKPKRQRKLVRSVYDKCISDGTEWPLPVTVAICQEQLGIDSRVVLRAVGAKAISRAVVEDDNGKRRVGHAYELGDRLFLQTDHGNHVLDITVPARATGWEPGMSSIQPVSSNQVMQEARAATRAHVMQHMAPDVEVTEDCQESSRP